MNVDDLPWSDDGLLILNTELVSNNVLLVQNDTLLVPGDNIQVRRSSWKN